MHATLTVSDGRALRTLADGLEKPLLGVVITQPHPDHYGGLVEPVRCMEVPRFATAGVIEVARRDDAVKEQILRPMFGDEWATKRAFPDTPVADGETITLGDIAVAVTDLGPGESPHDSVWTVEGQDTVFSADLAYNRMHCYLADGYSAEWLRSIDRLLGELPASVTLRPGHGEACGLEGLSVSSVRCDLARRGAISVTSEWGLSQAYDSADGSVAYDILGDGPSVVLVHGTPSWSYLWRSVANELAGRFTVHVSDLLGYGTSEKRDGQDVSIGAQTRILSELLDLWDLREPCIVGHDFGGAIALRLMLLEERSFRRVALCDAVAIAPWITPFSRHVQRYLEAFQTVPEHIHRQVIAAHLRTAIARDMTDAELEPYLRPWLGPVGQAAYYRQVAQFDERYTREIEPRYREIGAPTLVLWGERDGWLAPEFGRRLADAIPDARLTLIPDAGHFLPEDQPAAVVAALTSFFAAD